MVRKEEKMKAAMGILELYPLPKDLGSLSNESFSKYYKSISDGIRVIDSLKNYDLVNFTLEDLDGYLELLKGLRTIEYKFPENTNSTLKSHLQAMAKYFGKLGTVDALEAEKEIMDLLADKNKSKLFSRYKTSFNTNSI